MGYSTANFTDIPWAQGAHPLEQKKVADGGMTLLQFEPGFDDPNWCERSHALFVVQGTLHLEFESETVALEAGAGIWIDPGTPHRASVRRGAPAIVFAVSDLVRP